jgi:outer membrane beta-barrel protein
MVNLRWLTLGVILITGLSSTIFAADATTNSTATKKGGKRSPSADGSTPAATPTASTPAAAGDEAEGVEVEDIKKKYWARGNKSEMGVVQDRLYPKLHRFEISAGASSLIGDPFLSMHTFGGSLGFHFSELFSIHAVGWTAVVNPSSALTTLQSQTGASANTNQPQNYFGGEGRASLLYGKLNLVDAMILYFDTYLSAGAGRISTETGNNFLVNVGIGEQIHITRTWSINLDYKALYYQETILAKYASGSVTVGQNLGSRSNLSNLVTVSVSCFLNFFE